MIQKQYELTPEGYARLEAELLHLRTVRRPQVAEKIKRAKEMGGTDHNADYEEAKNDQAFVEGRILELENILKNAVVIRSPGGASRVQLGSRVTVANPEGKLENFTLVGSTEANPLEGKVSHLAPVGQALMGRKVGDEVEVKAPGGVIRLRIVQIE